MGNCIYCADDWFPCRLMGYIGLPYFEQHRKPLMWFSGLLAVITTVLAISAACSLSTDTGTMKNTAWSLGSMEFAETYSGLSGIILVPKEGAPSIAREINIRWDSEDCDRLLGVSGTCEDCRDASSSAATTAIMSCLAIIPKIKSSIERYTQKGDHACAKLISVVAGIYGCITALSAISAFVDNCTYNLPGKGRKHTSSSAEFSAEVDYELGPGLNTLIACVVLSTFNTVLHLLLPSPGRRDRIPVREGSKNYGTEEDLEQKEEQV